MHTIEPYYNWRNIYIASEDEKSPFYGAQYSETEYTNTIYNHYIHPQWDSIGSPTLFIKVLFVDYDDGYAIMELIGEWNDCLHNDIMLLKREIIDEMTYRGINKFILITENVLNFHPSDDSYYEEWFDDVEDGWIALLNIRDHVQKELEQAQIDQYFVLGGVLNDLGWRNARPIHLYQRVEQMVQRRLSPAQEEVPA